MTYMSRDLFICKHNYDGIGHCDLFTRGSAKEYCVEGPCKSCEYVRYKVALRAKWVVRSYNGVAFEYCSRCGNNKPPFGAANYCGKCGSEMVNDEEVC